jgi:PilZ domain
MSLKPDLSVKVVVAVDSRSGQVTARNSVIYQVNGENLIIAQTEPSIKSSILNKQITVTYLVTENDRLLRFGFPALVTEFIDWYEPVTDRYVKAIVVRKRNEPKPHDIRMCYRVGPSSRSGLDAFICDKKVSVIDISVGGIRFSYELDLPLEPHLVVDVRLRIGKSDYTIKARTIRTWEAENSCFGKELNFAAAEFLDVSARTEQELSRKILDIERESPFSGSKPHK